MPGVAQKVGQFARVEPALPLRARREQLAPARIETAVQLGEKGERPRRENLRVAGSGLALDHHAGDGRGARGATAHALCRSGTPGR